MLLNAMSWRKARVCSIQHSQGSESIHYPNNRSLPSEPEMGMTPFLPLTLYPTLPHKSSALLPITFPLHHNLSKPPTTYSYWHYHRLFADLQMLHTPPYSNVSLYLNVFSSLWIFAFIIKGSKNVFHKTSRDVGMVHCVTKTMGNCTENPTGRKSRYKKVYSGHHKNPGQHLPASRHWYVFTILTSGNISS